MKVQSIHQNVYQNTQNIQNNRINFAGNEHMPDRHNSGGGLLALSAALALAAALLASPAPSRQTGQNNAKPSESIRETAPSGSTDKMHDAGKVLMEQKYFRATRDIQYALETYKYLHDEVWNNFPSMYNVTADLDGTYPEETEKDEPEGISVREYNLDLDYGRFYLNYGIISDIASKKIEPWNDVSTAWEAKQLITKLAYSAENFNGGEHSEISGDRNITKGELDVIYMVLDKLDGINPETAAVSAIYRKALQDAEATTEAKRKEAVQNIGLGIMKPKSDEIMETLAENFDTIDKMAGDIKRALAQYESTKADFLAGSGTGSSENNAGFRKLYTDYIKCYVACNGLINTNPHLNSNVLNPTFAIFADDFTSAIETAEEACQETLDQNTLPKETTNIKIAPPKPIVKEAPPKPTVKEAPPKSVRDTQQQFEYDYENNIVYPRPCP